MNGFYRHRANGHAPRPQSPMRRATTEAVKRAAWRVSPRMLNLLARPWAGQVFSIGIYTGTSPLSLADPDDVRNPVITGDDVTDVPAAFVADPFMIHRGDRWYMFMEVMNRLNRRGEIAVAESPDARTWHYRRVVLREPFHLAYPLVFPWAGETYLVPDSPGRGVRLYRATRFPWEWTPVAQLLPPRGFSDSTLFRHRAHWWLLAGWAPRRSDPMSLRLFQAAELPGPWREHPRSPLVTRDDRTSRPAGPVHTIGGRLFRLAQDCHPAYGTRVRAFEILELDAERYVECPASCRSVLEAGPDRWHSGGMHHVNAHPGTDGGWIACVDGWYQPA